MMKTRATETRAGCGRARAARWYRRLSSAGNATLAVFYGTRELVALLHKDQGMSGARKRALIAEDDEALRRMMVALLRPLDIQVDEARDGLEAVERLRDQRYDVVIVDLMMPRVDGYSVIRYLEQKQPQARAIVTSAVNDDDLAPVARSNVVRGVLSKPFDIDEFSTSVRDAIAA
jgi:CheY-like chemotaxis protein